MPEASPSPEPSPTPLEDTPPPPSFPAAYPSPPSMPPPSPTPLSPAPAPPCTVEMLKQRTAGDKSWPIACSDTTLGTANEELDLSGAHLSYGDFKDTEFIGVGVIKLNGAGLANADLSGSKITAEGKHTVPDNPLQAIGTTIDFSGADLENADLSGSKLTAYGAYSSYSTTTIDFSEANLENANLSGSELSAISGSYLYASATIDFTKANLANADLSGSQLTSESSYETSIIDFTKANLTNADLSGAELTAIGSYGEGSVINFTNADLANADLSDWKLKAGKFGKGSIIGLEQSAPVDLSLTVVGESTGYDGVAALLIAALLIAIPLVGTIYVAARHGAGKVPLWFKLHFSHSNPNVVWFYLSAEERNSMRQRLCGDKGDSLAATEPTADKNLGPSRRAKILLQTPAAGSTTAAITAAQKWLAQAEEAATPDSSC